MDSNSVLTESEEMYLVTIALLLEGGATNPVPISLLASELNIAAVSANQMVRKLEECELVCYSPYKGVSLTEDGERAALRVLRHRRLWEVFLVEHLQFSAHEAEVQACRVEHVFPNQAVERLAEYLGHPKTSPRGKPIPATADSRLESDFCLCQLSAGQEGRVRHIGASPAARTFLTNQGLNAGDWIRVLATAQSGDMLVSVSGVTVNLAAEVVQTIRIQALASAPSPNPKQPAAGNQ